MLLTLSRVPSAGAQPSWTVFPAKAVSSSVSVTQPTGHGVTLVLNDSTVRFVVNELAQQAHLQVTFVENPMLAKRIAVHVVNQDVTKALAEVLRGTGLEAKFAADGEALVIRAKSATSRHGMIVGGIIVGWVTDSASGAGLGGVSVKIAGTKLTGVTSDSGHFTFSNVPSGSQVLTVRLFGYKPADRTVTVVDSERTIVRIALVAVPTVLSQVVTTATGLQRRIEIGNDITTLNVDSIRQTAPITSVTDLLETRVPGLTVLHSSGVPGDPSRLRLRGDGSAIGNNDPIFIIDGIRVYSSQSDPRNNNLAPTLDANAASHHSVPAPSPIDQLDPASIETIEVFKGPSATALYGSDAANGVIVITTKHGRSGPTHWNLDLGQGVNWLPGAWPTNMFRFGSGNDNVSSGSPFCVWNDPTCIADSVVAFQALNDPRYTVFSHGEDQMADLTVSGGVPTVQYSLSGNVSGDLGNLKLSNIEQQRYEKFHGALPHWMVRPDNLQSWGVNGSLTTQPTQAIRVTLTGSLFNSTQQRSGLENAIQQLEGVYIDPTQLAVTPTISNVTERETDHELTSADALTFAWQARSWLPLNATVGMQTIQRADETLIPFGFSLAAVGGDTAGYFGLGHGTSQNQTLTVGTTIPLWQQRVNLALGANAYQQSTADVQASTNQLGPGISVPTDFPALCPGSTSICSSFNQATTATATYGWYVQPQFNVASRFFVSPGFRLDGGSGGSHLTNADGSAGGLSAFPKVNLSYVAVDRQGDRPLGGVLTLLRPRLALGYSGVQPAPADRLRIYNLGVATQSNPGGEGYLGNNGNGAAGSNCLPLLSVDGTTSVPAVCLSTLGNTQLRPERTSELEGGFDATLWNGRLSLTYTQFDKTTHDALLTIPIAPSVSGYAGVPFNVEKNIGEIRNTGTELTINTFLLQSRAVSWNVGASFSNTNNLVVHLNPGQGPIVLPYDGLGLQTRVTPGYPVFGMWARPILGFADLNHDHIIEPDEVVLGDSAVYVGEPNPKYTANLTTDATFLNGRFSVHATFAYQNGLTQNNYAALNSGAFAALGNSSPSFATQAALAAAGIGGANAGDMTDIGLIQTVNTFRFQDLSLNYTVPRGIAAWFRVPRMVIAVQGSNLGLYTNYRGKDPDVNAFTTVASGDEIADLGQIPEPRTWWLKLTLGN